MIYSNDNKIIEQAIQRELFRSGQVFYLCNDIAQHPAVVARLKALFPSARIDSVHGKLKETALERCMTQFYHQRLDILVGTTIIETGIDVPTANTMIIENAHHFGLAQLHQIRGRVGRSHHQAYAYLMIPLPLEQLSDIARARLELLVQYQDLAAGFQLATHDLEIRGAGELLGEKQSGHILDLGIDLYRQMLDEACKTLSHKKPLDTKVLLQYEIARPFAIAPQQIPDPSMRLKIYHHFEQIYDIETFLKECHAFNDRFGKALPATQDWIASHRFRILAHSWKWRQLKWRKNQPLLIEFAPKNEPESCSEKKIESFVGRHAKFITVLSPRTVALSIPTAHQQRIVSLLSNLFDSLEEDALDSEKMLWDD
jgi:transcription-repair coupling factor (superfamily II helicase)